jgi:hypothetical protein
MINFDLLREIIRTRTEELCCHFFPNGRKEADEWKLADVSGGPGSSLAIQLTGDKAGLWLDRETGQGGDFVHLLCANRNLTRIEAAQEIGRALGVNLESNAVYRTPSCNSALVKSTHSRQKRRPLKLKGLEECSDDDLQQIFTLRAIPIEGLRLAVQRRLLFAYNHFHHGRCFVMTDDARRCAISRKIDGKPFQDRDPKTGEITEKKSKCWYGSEGNWPIGAAHICDLPAVALCEGIDCLAAFWLSWASAVEQLVAPVCMTGASCRIHEDALPLLRGKRVRIFGHADAAGQGAVRRWAQQLQTVHAEVDGFDFSGLVKSDDSPVKDLNDFILADHKRSGYPIEVLTGAFDFALERKG